MIFKGLRRFAPFLTTIALLYSPALAQQAAPARPPVDVLSASNLPADAVPFYDNEPTHPALSLTPDKSELVHLDREAGTIIVGNPEHLSVLLEGTQNLVLVGKEPGATYFSVLDDEGKVIMQRHVLVAAPREHYIRVRRSCAGSSDENCRETSVFYCPDMCHKVSVSGETSGKLAGGQQGAPQDMTQATGAEIAPQDQQAPGSTEPAQAQ